MGSPLDAVAWRRPSRAVGWIPATPATAAPLRASASCFAERGLRRVTAGCLADNVASWRLMERVGMRRETHAVGESPHRSGHWLDGLGYALLADE